MLIIGSEKATFFDPLKLFLRFSPISFRLSSLLYSTTWMNIYFYIIHIFSFQKIPIQLSELSGNNLN